MSAEQRKFKKVIKARKLRNKKVKLGKNNHAMGNTVAVMMKRGQLKRTPLVDKKAPSNLSVKKLLKKVGIGKKKK